MKRKRPILQLSEKQQLILGLLLVILLAVSMLYCLGFASLVLRQTWENAPIPWDETYPSEEVIDLTPTPVSTPTDTDLAPY